MKMRRCAIATFTLILSFVVSTTIALVATPFNKTVEGVNSYDVTGESYASNIEFAGYNSRDNKFYTNLTVETTKAVAAGSIATFSYDINVFDGNSSNIGELGTGGILATVAAPAGLTTVQANNKIITLTTPLTSAFNEVVTIDHVSITP